MSFEFAGQIAPQRSTQYSSLASTLAGPELLSSPLGPYIEDWSQSNLGGLEYIFFRLHTAIDISVYGELLGSLAMFAAFFQVFRSDEHALLLKPLDKQYNYFVPLDIAYTRRYKGKTNELFTQFMLNVAKFASIHGLSPWKEIKLLDPLCGGGTTLLLGLALGADVGGIDLDLADIESTVTFIEQYAREGSIKISVRAEHIKTGRNARRWFINVGTPTSRKFMLANGNASDSVFLSAGLGRPNLIVMDLPYGIQHFGPILDLLRELLPALAQMLHVGGALAFSWDSTRLSRETVVEAVAQTGLYVVTRPPYDGFAHRVDRVIKRRDVIVAVKESA